MTTSQILKYMAVNLLAMGITIFIFYSINRNYQNRNKATVENAVSKAELKLSEELSKINLVIESMAFFFENTSEVSQPLFENFTNPFLRELNGIGALEWAPRVEDSMTGDDFRRFTIITKSDSTKNLIVSTTKGTHFPIRMLNPLESLQKAIGYDLYSDSIRRSAIDVAMETGKIALTGPMNLIMNNNGVPGIMAVKSVSDTLTNQVKGVVAGVYRMDALVENTLRAELDVFDICIHDETTESRLLFSNYEDKTDDFLKNAITKTFDVQNRIWKVHVIPKPKYLDYPHVFESYIVLFFGLISGLILTYAVKKRDGYNDRLEARVRLRTSELEASNALKENLLREIHHRVKNNLQITSSLMNMQKRKLTSKEAITAIEDSQARISAIALTHQKIYQEKDSKAVNLRDYLKDLMEYEKKISQSFSYKIECPEISIDLDNAVPLALIISELVTNAVKHAYPDSEKYNELLIHVERVSHESVSLTISDNGKGLPENFDIDKAEGIGFEIIRALCRQISSKLTFESNGEGTRFNLVFNNKQ